MPVVVMAVMLVMVMVLAQKERASGRARVSGLIEILLLHRLASPQEIDR
jgi:hypothetical protein